MTPHTARQKKADYVSTVVSMSYEEIKDDVRMRIYTTRWHIAKRLSANDSGKNVTMSKRGLFPESGCSLL